jgi:hypothetical protein
MRIPSLSKIPQYKRFSFEPRYYDPVKEEIKNRTELIEQDIKNTNRVDGAKVRITEAFARDRRKKSSGINFLQLIMVFVISATFIAFIYIGFYAFLLLGGFIFLYVLHQRGFFDQKRTFVIADDDSAAPEDSAASRISGKMREGRYFVTDRSVPRRGWYKLMLLASGLGLSWAYYTERLNGIAVFLAIFILLILFIKESSKAR